MKAFLYILGFFVALFLLLWIIGVITPVAYQGQMSATFDVPKEKVWKVLTDIETIPQRRREITDVEILGTNEEEHKIWKEYTDLGGHIFWEVLEEVPNEKWIIKMSRSTFGMKGVWKYELREEQNQTILTLTEESETSRPFVRGIMTLIGRSANLKQELRSLEKAVAK